MTADGAATGPSNEDVPAIDQMRAGRFPEEWNLIPVAGKGTYEKNWANTPLTREACEVAYKLNRAYGGLGVVTGSLSGGLIALDIDGADADERYRGFAGAEYEPFGEERTMAWTSGKPGRRQLLYKVPDSLLPQLEHVTTVIARADGEWYLGSADEKRTAKKAQGDQTPSGVEYQELVLRLNHCQSVLPGSPHPETKELYRWLTYNDGVVAMAPEWVVDLLRGFRKPSRWLSEADLAKMAETDTFATAVHPKQIRGWFFKDEVQAKLMPRLQDLVFRHEAFDTYGWRERGGSKPQMMSGCPWHGGTSGTAFQVNPDSGCWDCKACGVGGDVLDFVHKVAVNDAYAPRPQGADLEKYVAKIATELGYRYPEDLQRQEVVEQPRTVMSAQEFLDALIAIHDEERNPALRSERMEELARDTGRRYSSTECLRKMTAHLAFLEAEKLNNGQWHKGVKPTDYTIPNVLPFPCQVILHADGGTGKTSACMGLATAVGRGKTMRVRGIDVQVRQGPVLWIQNDQSPSCLMDDCRDNGIDPEKDKWFIVRMGFQLDHHHQFYDWIKEFRPALVVVDSIGSCSTDMEVEEKDKAFAHPFYLYSKKNGAPDGFPKTSIIWIHHNNAKGELRGTRYLGNAVDETWNMRKLREDEREGFREKGGDPNASRLITIGKSRIADREGDQLVAERDENFAYRIWDYTPTVRREDGGTGDVRVEDMPLGIIKDSVKAAGEDLKAGAMTAKAVWEEMVEVLGGQARKAPSQRTVQNLIDRLVVRGLLVEGRKTTSGEKGGRPSKTYTLARAYRRNGSDFSKTSSDPSPQQGLGFGKPEVVSKTLSKTPEAENSTNEPPPEPPQGVLESPEHFSKTSEAENPVIASDSGEFWKNGRGCDATRACAREADQGAAGFHAHIVNPEADLLFDLKAFEDAFLPKRSPTHEEGVE